MQYLPFAADDVISTRNVPRVFLLDGKHLQHVREDIRHGDESFEPALKSLNRDAKEALTTGPFSVIKKSDPA